MIRVVTTVLLAVAVLTGIWYLPLFWFQCFILFAIGLGLWEYAKLIFTETRDRAVTIVLGLTVAGGVTGWPNMALALPIGVLFLTFLWGLQFKEPLERAGSHVGLIFLGVCYLGLTLPFWSSIRETGREWVMLLLFPACLTDTFGFLVGKAFGRHKLAPVISPNKTWEGFFGGIFGGVFGLWLAGQLFFSSIPLSWTKLILIGTSISLLAILGDLIESLIKRSVGVKDSSHLIPGHGGVLDRLDALIFVAPFFYLLMQAGIL